MGVAAVPASVSEEYYQISQTILESFPKYRLPLDLYIFKDDIGQLVQFYKKDVRLSNEQIEKIHVLCAEGDLFVSRSDHPIYSKHIVKQLDLILVDQNLKEAEVADIIIRALEMRLTDFFDQPVRPAFELLHIDIQVVTEYLWTDKHRLSLLVRRLYTGDYTLMRHAINTMIVGLWLYLTTKQDEIKRKEFDQCALALLIHDIGMAKLPPFIINKTTPLKPEEKEKIPPHVLAGYKTMQKLDQTSDPVRQAMLEHHERLDGSGYPQHSTDISAFGRLTAVADAFSAMIQKRPYAPAKDLTTAAKELAGDKRFDFTFSSRIVTALVSNSFGKISR